MSGGGESLSELFARLENTADLKPVEEAKPAAFEAVETDKDGGAKMADLDRIMEFCLAGNAKFTLKSLKTETRFTYRISLSKDKNVAFVSLLTGPDNEESYSYFGNIRPRNWSYWDGKKAKISLDSPGAVAFRWFWGNLKRKSAMKDLEFWHSGACGRCGRTLTVPESIASGFGPECANRIGG